jgi:hypothetical protein
MAPGVSMAPQKNRYDTEQFLNESGEERKLGTICVCGLTLYPLEKLTYIAV